MVNTTEIEMASNDGSVMAQEQAKEPDPERQAGLSCTHSRQTPAVSLSLRQG